MITNQTNKKRWVLLSVIAILITTLIWGPVYAKEAGITKTVKEIMPGLLEGYLAPEMLPNSLKLLPPPPDEGSAAFALDEATSQQNLALRGTPRWKQAIKDANLMFPEAIESFASILDIPITEDKTPYLYMLLRRTLTDIGLSPYAAKTHYNRSRPFMKNNQPVCTPDDEKALRKDGSYPSGHTAIGWGWALLLCELFPQQTDELLKRGWEFGQSRIVCNAHWKSDVNQGRIMGAAAVARLHADPGFLQDLEAVKTEIAAIRSRK
ncbi:MAG: phosphatase PAP2 family protein [Deltaproteobacteria bacterium]|nr:phosphatase PAP2 family protein [Deltaproteobacteria bacterium]